MPIVGTSPEAIHLAEDRGAFGRVLADAGLPAPQARHGARRSTRPGGSPTRSATRCWSGRRTSSAAAAWRSSTTTSMLRDYIARGHRGQPRAPGAGRPVPRRRDRDRRRRAVRRRGALPRRRDGAHRGGRHPLRRLGLRAAADHARPRDIDAEVREPDRGASPAASACAACSTSSTRWPPTSSTCWRPTRGPAAPCRSCPRRPAVPLAKAAARVMLGATDRRAARRGHAAGRRRRRRRCRRRAGSSVKEAVLPFKRFRTVEGRGVDTCSGRRCAPPARSWASTSDFGTAFAKSQAAAYGGAADQGHASSCRSPTGTSGRMIFPVKRLADLGLRDPRHRGHRRGAAPQRRRRRRGAQAQRRPRPGRRADDRRADPRRRGRPGRQHAVRRRGARRDGYEIRTAAVAHGPCRSSRPCSSWRLPCRASRRSAAASSACARSRSTPRLRAEAAER